MAQAPTQSLVDTPSRVFYRRGDGGADPRRRAVPGRGRLRVRPSGGHRPLHQGSRSLRPARRRAPPAGGLRRRGYTRRSGLLALAGQDPLARRLHRRHLQLGKRHRRGGRCVVRARHACRTCSGWTSRSRRRRRRLWSKAFVMERERFDGADVAHIILAHGDELDWNRLLDRFGAHWRVLLAHLVLYGFIFPSRAPRCPPGSWRSCSAGCGPRLGAPDADDPVCYGTLLSWSQYLGDVLGGSSGTPASAVRVH